MEFSLKYFVTSVPTSPASIRELELVHGAKQLLSSFSPPGRLVSYLTQCLDNGRWNKACIPIAVCVMH
jgi:hypothetical protein